MEPSIERSEGGRPGCKSACSGSVEWIRALPDDLLEPHPLVRELRRTLEAKVAALADKEREITRLQAALAFGLKELPHGSGRPEGPSVG